MLLRETDASNRVSFQWPCRLFKQLAGPFFGLREHDSRKPQNCTILRLTATWLGIRLFLLNFSHLESAAWKTI